MRSPEEWGRWAWNQAVIGCGGNAIGTREVEEVVRRDREEIFREIRQHIPQLPLPIRVVSYPRAGHSLIRSVVLNYFGLDIEKHWCEYYHCCRNYPCTKKDARVMKSHDFALDARADRYSKLVVGVRHPYECFLSDFMLRVNILNYEPTKKRFCQFLDDAIHSYKPFFSKWAFKRAEADFYFEYHDFVANFPKRFRALHAMIAPGTLVDEQALARVASEVGVRHRVEDYVYHDPKYLTHVENELRDEVAWLKGEGVNQWITRGA